MLIGCFKDMQRELIGSWDGYVSDAQVAIQGSNNVLAKTRRP